MNPLYLIDNSNFAYKYRSVHTYAKVSVSGVSVDTSVLVGYVRSLRSIIFDHIVIVLDGVPLNSLKILPEYKGQRIHEGLDTLGVSSLEIVKFLTKLGSLLDKDIVVVANPGQEADQVIASITNLVTGKVSDFQQLMANSGRRAFSEDNILKKYSSAVITDFDYTPYSSVVIGTTDSDIMQLSSPLVKIDNSTTGKYLSKNTASAVHGLPSYAIPFYKAIWGDISDNVPGIESLQKNKKSCEELSWIDNPDKQQIILSFLYTSKDSSDIPLSLKKLLLKVKEDISTFTRNWEVVHLTYVSTPFVLSFPDYDIESTIKRYNIKI